MTRLHGRRVAFTGRLSAMKRDEAAAAIREHGGEFVSSVSRKTDLLVVGQEGSPLAKDGGLTLKLLRARELADEGHAIEILSEDEFLAELGRERESRHYTLAQLSRILGISGARLRTWVRKGLVKPIRTEHRLHYFEFRDVAAAKAVAELVQSGVSPERIRASVAELAAWLPASGDPFLEVGLEKLGRDLVVRLDDGQLADTRGQFQFDFDAPADVRPMPSAVSEPEPLSWFEQGLAREDAGDPAGAARAYGLAIAEDRQSPETYFNLGNVLFELGRKEDAARRFEEAVALDTNYVEAWNNLGNALADSGRRDDAVRAFERALLIAPDYADAHYNAAEVLYAVGRQDAARCHWRAYLALDGASTWAEHVRSRLDEA